MKIWEINTGDQQVNDLLCSFGDKPQDGLFSLSFKSWEVRKHDPEEMELLRQKKHIVIFCGNGEVLS